MTVSSRLSEIFLFEWRRAKVAGAAVRGLAEEVTVARCSRPSASIRIPPTCLDALSDAAVRMRAFESEAHFLMRRTDLTPSDKPGLTKQLLGKYGFA